MKNRTLTAILAGAILLSSGCASQNALRRGDYFRGCELQTVHKTRIHEENYYTVDFKDKDYNHYIAAMNQNGKGLIHIKGKKYNVRFIDSSNPDKRAVILIPAEKQD